MPARSTHPAAQTVPERPVSLFVSYSHRDEDSRNRLDTHMAQLKREGVDVFFDGQILPGAELDSSIRKKLWSADVFVALASPDYLSSRYCYEIEYGFAMRKAKRKALHVVVAVLKACQWRQTRMARYKLLPTDGKPVDQWARRGDAYEDIVEGIRKVVRAVKRERSAQTAAADAASGSGASRSRGVARAPTRAPATAAKPNKLAAAPKEAKSTSPSVRKQPAAGGASALRPKATAGTGKRPGGRTRPRTST